VTKWRRIKRASQETSMGERRNACRNFVEKSIEKRPHARRTRRGEVKFKMNVRMIIFEFLFTDEAVLQRILTYPSNLF
jgi:outer membrane phospholipase A